jgi:hypothetical protein
VSWSSRATLPPLPIDTVQRLQIAQDEGRLHLADVDEAELLAAGVPAHPDRLGTVLARAGTDGVAADPAADLFA